MKRERFACNYCPAFYECCKPHMKPTAGGWETAVINGKDMVICRPAENHRGGREMQQYAFYCLATKTGKKIANKADYTGNVPVWCPRLEGEK